MLVAFVHTLHELFGYRVTDLIHAGDLLAATVVGKALLSVQSWLQGRNLSKFDHVKNDRQVVSAEEVAAQQADPVYSLKHMSEDTKRIMAKLNSSDSATVRLQAHAWSDLAWGHLSSTVRMM